MIFIKKIKNSDLLPLAIMLVFIFFFVFTNQAESKDIYFGAQSTDNINVVGKLCIGGNCYSAWPNTPWNIHGDSIYYNVINGNVGIGKSNPVSRLDVVGTATFSDPLVGVTPQSNQGLQLATVEYVANAMSGSSGPWSISGNHIYSNNNGNVGIGVTNPSQRLEISGSIRLPNTTSATTGVIYKGDDSFIHNFSHPTGGGDKPDGNNLFIGRYSGNFSMGATASYNFEASYNTGVGYGTLFSNTTGYRNSAFGASALESNTTGSSNSAFGYLAMRDNNVGYNNTAFGAYALYPGNSGTLNTALGYEAGAYLANNSNRTGGNYGLYVGAETKASANGNYNENVIGFGVIGAGSDSVVLGNDNIIKTLLKGNVGIAKTNPIHKLSVGGTVNFDDLAYGVTPPSNQPSALTTVEYLDAFKDDLFAQLGLCGGRVTDIDGNKYGTVQIGDQCWMTENMRVGTMLASGATMPNTGDNIIEKWCYDNNPSNCETDGGLYHWDEAMRGSTEPGAQGICPTGWHIPTDQEWNDLEQYVVSVIASPNNQYSCDLNATGYKRCGDDTGTNQGANGVGQALRLTGKGTGVGTGTDLVGFKGDVPGYRNSANGTFGLRGSYYQLWSSSLNGSVIWKRLLASSYSTSYRSFASKDDGLSVRCVRV